MRQAIWMLVVLGMAGCGDESASGSANAESVAEMVAPKPAVHFYVVADGGEYGYEQGVSQSDMDNGKMANSLMMFRYAGEHDGKHQVYSKDALAITVIECSDPCEFMKVMTFAGTVFIRKELVRATEGTIGWGVMTDAINGFLQVHKTKDGKSHPWFDEKKGIHFIPLADAKAEKQESPI